jgi:hypothetical protein
MIPRYYVIAESDHELQNPTSVEKIVLLGERLGLGPESLEGTVAAIESHGVRVVGVIAASQDDWDRYETLHWSAVEEWLAANEGDPDAAEVRSMHERSKQRYLGYRRDSRLAIFACWKPTA